MVEEGPAGGQTVPVSEGVHHQYDVRPVTPPSWVALKIISVSKEVGGGAVYSPVYLSSNTGGDRAVIMVDVPLGLTGVHHLQADLEASIVDDPVVSVLQYWAVLRDKPPGQHPHGQG